MIYLLQPTTKTMLSQLRKARAIELSTTGNTICAADDFKGSLATLSRRGFVSTKIVIRDGKEILGVYITQAGKMFLNQEDAKKLGNVYNIM